MVYIRRRTRVSQSSEKLETNPSSERKVNTPDRDQILLLGYHIRSVTSTVPPRLELAWPRQQKKRKKKVPWVRLKRHFMTDAQFCSTFNILLLGLWPSFFMSNFLHLPRSLYSTFSNSGICFCLILPTPQVLYLQNFSWWWDSAILTSTALLILRFHSVSPFPPYWPCPWFSPWMRLKLSTVPWPCHVVLWSSLYGVCF